MKWLYKILPTLWGLLWVMIITLLSVSILIWVAQWFFSLIGLI